MWWKPFLDEKEIHLVKCNWDNNQFNLVLNNPQDIFSWIVDSYSLNDLCSIDSWLRQFICEKWLYDKELKDKAHLNYSNTHHKWFTKNQRSLLSNHYFEQNNYEYRLMLSSIQSDKTKFLLDNIILDEQETK